MVTNLIFFDSSRIDMSTFFVRLAVISVICLLPTVSLAADAANRSIIGFSNDGRVFGFEEFGVRDGSGFPYSNIYIIDTKTDRWKPGTPIRVLVEDEKAQLRVARDRAKKRARSIIKRYGLTDPGRILASNAVSEIVGDSKSISFQRFHNIEDSIWTVKIEKLRLETPKSCADTDLGPIVGLALNAGKKGYQLKELYRDRKIPASRSCPLDYKIADVIVPNSYDTDAAIVLLHSLSFGFEGMDSRFLAISIQFDEAQPADRLANRKTTEQRVNSFAKSASNDLPAKVIPQHGRSTKSITTTPTFRHGLIRRQGSEFIAPFRIMTSPGSNYFFKLLEIDTQDEILAGFVEGGRLFDAKVPPGIYELRYAAGESWISEIDYFGPGTTFAKTNNPLSFTVENDRVRGVVVELIRQRAGNLQTTKIGRADF